MRVLFTLLCGTLAAFSVAQRFKPVQVDGVWWLQTPAKQNLFSLGVCVVDSGIKWSEYDLKNPAFAGFRFYPNQSEWANDTVHRLSEWGFNTIGAWSEYSALKNVPDNKLYLTPILHMGSSAGAPWLDMWAPETVKTMNEVAQSQIKELGDKSRVVGYFSDNELGWWRGAMFEWVWKNKTPYTRQVITDWLKGQYKSNWKSLLKDFDPEGATSFASLRKKGRLFVRPGNRGNTKVRQILGLLAQRYYSLCHSIIKKYDPDALYLGDRYISNYYPEVAIQAGKYCDVVSTNLNADWTDGTYNHFHLDQLTKLTHKPLMVTEYYMSAMENSSGNKNDSSGFPTVQTQDERARNFARETTNLLHEPNLVGAHWFQYYDEPQNGRGDGENYNFGLVDTSNRPYRSLLSALGNLDQVGLHRAAKPFIPPSENLIPRLKGSALDSTQWNRTVGYISPSPGEVRGELVTSWSEDQLCLNLIWYEDRFSESLYRSGKVPDIDLPSLTLTIPNRSKQWTLKVHADGAVDIFGPAGVSAKAKYDAKSHLYIQIPSRFFGDDRLASGDTIRLDAKLLSQTRTYLTNWKIRRTLTNAN